LIASWNRDFLSLMNASTPQATISRHDSQSARLTPIELLIESEPLNSMRNYLNITLYGGSNVQKLRKMMPWLKAKELRSSHGQNAGRYHALFENGVVVVGLADGTRARIGAGGEANLSPEVI